MPRIVDFLTTLNTHMKKLIRIVCPQGIPLNHILAQCPVLKLFINEEFRQERLRIDTAEYGMTVDSLPEKSDHAATLVYVPGDADFRVVIACENAGYVCFRYDMLVTAGGSHPDLFVADTLKRALSRSLVRELALVA